MARRVGGRRRLIVRLGTSRADLSGVFHGSAQSVVFAPRRCYRHRRPPPPPPPPPLLLLPLLLASIVAALRPSSH